MSVRISDARTLARASSKPFSEGTAPALRRTVPAVPNPHDALFKAAFGDTEEARALLRSQLPQALVDDLDWSRLARVPGSFVDGRLRERHTDLLFVAPLRGTETLFYVLLEHQSRADRWMPLRLVQYQLRVWERWRRDHPQSKTLPVVVPVVVHHGPGAWSEATELQALFDVPPGLAAAVAPFLIRQRFLLDDLARTSHEHLDRRALTLFARLTLRALIRLRHLSVEETAHELEEWVELCRALVAAPSGLPKLSALLHYLIQVTEISEPDLVAFTRRVHAPREENDTMATLAEKWMAQGHEEGRQAGHEEGRQAGHEEGRQAGRYEALLQLLDLKFSTLPAGTAERVRAAAPEAVERWTARVLSAERLVDVFED